MKYTKIAMIALILFFIAEYSYGSGNVENDRWSATKANEWYANHDWIIGCNYVPYNAINQLEMWQEDTFSPEVIDRELGWAESLGFNSLRVFLHYLPWKEDKDGFYNRLDEFLDICDKHGINVMLIFFDDVWHPNPKPGLQPEPIKGVHNSGWVQCPGKEILQNLELYEKDLEGYVKETMKRYSKDRRVLIWDLYNEPANPNKSSYGEIELKNKEKYSLKLLEKVFTWAREVNPSQPICADVWTPSHADINKLSPVDKFCYDNSDVINFHAYFNEKLTEKVIKMLAASGRPIICTEYMARTANSRFENILPLFKKYNIGAYNWGFVNGKSNTIYPWKSWDKPFDSEPEVWFHDIFRKDGTPFSEDEVQLIKSLIAEE
ncbi:MAG: cellulase family glycosylhydrolase [Cytophagales bacterium]|nr:cellulase family glycosylhydrolase [Cytophagales bacterium]